MSIALVSRARRRVVHGRVEVRRGGGAARVDPLAGHPLGRLHHLGGAVAGRGRSGDLLHGRVHVVPGVHLRSGRGHEVGRSGRPRAAGQCRRAAVGGAVAAAPAGRPPVDLHHRTVRRGPRARSGVLQRRVGAHDRAGSASDRSSGRLVQRRRGPLDDDRVRGAAGHLRSARAVGARTASAAVARRPSDADDRITGGADCMSTASTWHHRHLSSGRPPTSSPTDWTRHAPRATPPPSPSPLPHCSPRAAATAPRPTPRMSPAATTGDSTDDGDRRHGISRCGRRRRGLPGGSLRCQRGRRQRSPTSPASTSRRRLDRRHPRRRGEGVLRRHVPRRRGHAELLDGQLPAGRRERRPVRLRRLLQRGRRSSTPPTRPTSS